MRPFAKISFLAVTILIFVSSCTNNETDSPYSELFLQKPYKAVSDSIRQNPKNAELYFHRASVLINNNELPPALADLLKAWKLDKKEDYAMGISNLLMMNKPDSAITFLKDAVKEFPNSINLQINLAQVYFNKQQNDEALKINDAILKKDVTNIDALLQRADILEAKNDTAAATETLEAANMVAKDDKEITYRLAFQYAQSRNSKVLHLCDSLIKADSVEKHGEPYYFKGIYYSNINDKIMAVDQLNQAILNDYTFLDAYMEKGRILYDEKKYKDAAGVYSLALKISNSYADTYLGLAKCQEALGQKEDAKLNYLRAWGLDKSLTEAKQAADNIH